MKMTKTELEFVKFSATDIITTSGEGGGSEDNSKLAGFKGGPVIDDTDKSLTQSYSGWNGFFDTTGGYSQ